MSAVAPTVTARCERSRPVLARTAATGRPGVRVVTFAALTAYGLERWATLMRPDNGWRLFGVFALAVALAALVPLLRRVHPALAGVSASALVVATFPVAGERWHWLTHLKIALNAYRIGNGLEALPTALVPYIGSSHAVRTVIVLGAAVLALDAAAVLATAPAAVSDGRRAAAALPLLALAVVPGTLVRPEFPYLQGLLLFALVAAFMWSERIRRDAIISAIVIASLAGVGAAIAAPRIDQRQPWIDYRAWASTLVRRTIDTFDWNQTYGPLRWPRSGHQVLTVTARTADYWKAEDLDTFNGVDWVAGARTIVPALPAPLPSALKRWSQEIQVTLDGMTTDNVIAAGYAAQPSSLPGGLREGTDPGTWIAGRPIAPGTGYVIDTYSPRPSAGELRSAGRDYPAPALANDLMLTIPIPGLLPGASSQVAFAPFYSHGAPTSTYPSPIANATGVLLSSPYGRAYALARRLAAQSRTPYAFVMAVQRYLSRGFTYSENPPVTSYPLATFLFTDRKGYCQQFSGAMAMLLRMGGVPARVAAGFTSGTLEDHRWVVTDTDAHAWVEVWFPRYGWVRFDPTPASAPARADQNAIPFAKPLPTPAADVSGALRREIGGGPGAGPAGHAAAAGGLSAWLIVAALAMLALLAGLGRVLLRAGGSAEQRLVELERALSRTGRPLADGVTLAALERRFASSPEAAGYIRALRLARYGGRPVTPSAGQRRALRLELGRGLGAVGRLRAMWALPPRPRWPGAGTRGS